MRISSALGGSCSLVVLVIALELARGRVLGCLLGLVALMVIARADGRRARARGQLTSAAREGRASAHCGAALFVAALWSQTCFPAHAQEGAIAAVSATAALGESNVVRRRTPSRRSLKDPHRHARFAPYFAEAARVYQLPVELLWAVARVESDFTFRAVSGDGALGVMQLMPFNLPKMGVRDAYDPRQNILGGARLLRLLANRWDGDLVRTIASYNAGANAVKRYGGVPPYKETQRYVRRVLWFYNAYRAERRKT